LTCVKDPIALEHRTGVVYSAPWHDCPVTYVGQTSRTLSHRLKVLALFYINWYPGKRSAPADGNEESTSKRPREECKLRFTCIPSHNPLLFSCLCTSFALANPTTYKQAFRSANISASAVAEHAIISGHTIAWDEVLIMDSNPHLHPRCAHG